MPPPRGTFNVLEGPGDYDVTSIVHNDTYPTINPAKLDLAGKAVFISGGSKGLGRAIVLSFATAGASYIAVGARSDVSSLEVEIHSAAKSAHRAAPKFLPLKLDITDQKSVDEAAVAVEKEFGKCDIVVSNAGILAAMGKIADSDPQEWWNVFEVNVRGSYLISRAFLPLLTKSDGPKYFVQISSVGAHLIGPRLSAYQTSKLAVLRLSQFIDAEYSDQGVISFAVHPGNMPTDMVGGSNGVPDHLKHIFIDTPALGADTIAYLTSEQRAWLGGRYINVTWDMSELMAKAEEIMGDQQGDASSSMLGPGLPADAVPEEVLDKFPYLLPTRWWLASTAFPLLAGTFGPMASAFSICALSQQWRAQKGSPQTGQQAITIKDPAWALAVNWASLAIALVANLALLLNMTRRITFFVGQPVTIGGWYISSLLLVCLTAIMPRVTDLEKYQMSQAYYYAIIAACVYFVLSSLLLITMYGATTRHYSQHFHLTTSQRSLMLQTIIYMIYLLAGAAVYAHIEGWSYLDSVYWADFTLLTNGIGDLAPKTHLGRSLLFPYAVGGILTLGLIVRSIAELVLQRGKNKLTARVMEKTRAVVANRVKTGKEQHFPFHRFSPQSSELTEQEKHESEFHLMRRIHDVAAWELRWFSLSFSLLAWATLWIIGAVAFWKAERDANWSYFTALYFAYTNILTIGYGDVVLGQTWGKPFFVFWSLLSVPTMTILISHMGDTIARVFHDAAIFAGELTFLPEERGFKHTLRVLARKLRKLTWSSLNETSHIESQFQTVIFSNENRLKSEKCSFKGETIDAMVSRHQRWYKIMQELRRIYRDIDSQPAKRYTYEEWCFYLKLLGRFESISSLSQGPLPAAKLSKPQRVAFLANKLPLASIGNKWSWIGIGSPLLGNKDEAEWIFDALSSTLEKEMEDQCTMDKQENLTTAALETH
ncbi:Potassium channel [Myotisia sp. PD_48]|nr:Potassium channel [Myotisia sp. PD_48]